jgi:hypothetical protein
MMIQKLADQTAVKNNYVDSTQQKEKIGKISIKYLGLKMASQNQN